MVNMKNKQINLLNQGLPLHIALMLPRRAAGALAPGDRF
jgi:hypothetical protein